ncbi:MAG: hypothetical protein ACI4VK_00560 [Candidatus Coproplasma sp.]
MKKLFKRVSLVLLTVCAVFACMFALSACDRSPKYVFTIQYEDGTPCTEVYFLQICTDSSCYEIKDVKPDANGKVTLSQNKVDQICNPEVNVTKFSFHVFIETENDFPDFPVEVDGANEYTIIITQE